MFAVAREFGHVGRIGRMTSAEMFTKFAIHCAVSVPLFFVTLGSAEEPPETRFERTIAPVLRDHCVRCHSATNRSGDVSLSTSADLLDGGYVVPGRPDESSLLELIQSEDNERPEMPEKGEPLTPEQVAAIRHWIEEGAVWPKSIVLRPKVKPQERWWAYEQLRTVMPGDVRRQLPEGQAGGNPVDDFIRAKLAENGLQPSKRADRRTLIRRVTFDLHGLPPTPDEVEAFVNDPDPLAYERLVDRLLASPRYGERFAQFWLDLAHYADTHGFERDRRRDHAWRYRDYVIESLNQDKPYDRFLQEQIAGDVLWPDDPQSVIATGFLAAGPWDYVGQVETKSPALRRAARSLDLDDIVTQVMTCTMATTINCARCHDHKLDPISQQEYYELRAVFAGVRRGDRVVSDAAQRDYELYRARLEKQARELDIAIRRLESPGRSLADIVGGGDGTGNGSPGSGIDPQTGEVLVSKRGGLPSPRPNQYQPSDIPFVDGVVIPDGAAQVPVSTTGLRVAGIPHTSGSAWDAIRNGPVNSQHSPELDGIDFTRAGHDLLGLHANAAVTFDLEELRKAMKVGRKALRFTARVGYFGATGDYSADAWIMVDGRIVLAFRDLKRATGLQAIDVKLPADARFLTLMSTDGGNGYSMDQIGFADPRIRLADVPDRSTAQESRLHELRRARQQVSKRLQALRPPPKVFAAVCDTAVPEVRLLARGNPETPVGDPVAPRALSILAHLDRALGNVDSSDAERRAAFAKWVTHPDNPLVKRVIVNRVWQWHFGRGIVDTPSDFGRGGGRPSHPELLDWLAAELPRRGWSLKSLHRLIVTSRTYCQQSHPAGDEASIAAKKDADNRLLWRQNPRRLEAEAIRDTVLSVSGNLNVRAGGPGYEDFIYRDAYAPIYEYKTADTPELWRRTIYRFRVRTTPQQFLTTLDCPDPANLTAKRLATTTPLQALALYNNEFMLQQAAYFAERVRNETGDDVAQQVKRAFALALSRQPSDVELRVSSEVVRKHGLVLFCRALLNTNEFLYVD